MRRKVQEDEGKASGLLLARLSIHVVPQLAWLVWWGTFTSETRAGLLGRTNWARRPRYAASQRRGCVLVPSIEHDAATPGPCGDGAAWPSALWGPGSFARRHQFWSPCLPSALPGYSGFSCRVVCTQQVRFPEGRVPFLRQPAHGSVGLRFSRNVSGLVHGCRRRCWSDGQVPGQSCGIAAWRQTF